MSNKLFLVCMCFLAACGFSVPAGSIDPADGSVDGDGNADGLPSDVADGGMPDAPPDALACVNDQIATPDGCQNRPRISCSLATINGQTKRQLAISGWISYGLLGGVTTGGATPSYIAYGSDYDSSSVMSGCNGAARWVIPYPSGCGTKPQVAWMGEGTNSVTILNISDNVENFNIAIVYMNGTVRWADLALDDGDPEGFTVGGSGSGYACHIIHPGGVGGVIQVAP